MTFHAFMSLVSTTRDGDFNRFGRVYWPLRDRVMELRWRLRS